MAIIRPDASLAEAMLSASHWLDLDALPFWASVGVDGSRGFVEHLTLDAQPAAVGFKRLRVQARQIYVFSHAHLRGFAGGIDAAASGWRFMRDHGWIESGNWARVLSRSGSIVDPTADLYDHAFALLAIAWWIRASGDDALSWAQLTLEAIDAHLSVPDGMGWWSEEGPSAALLQNPHMHLLEACLAAYEATDANEFRVYAEKIISLFETRFFDPVTGTLAEYFDRDWRRAAQPGGCVVEPGHQYEWVWLLCRASRWIPSAAERVEALFAFAERFGSDHESELIYDQVLDDGFPAKTTHRLWPNTEALKAHLARFELGRPLDPSRLQGILRNLLTYYLGSPTRETWVDQLDSEMQPSVDKIPASSLYHLHLALAELERLEPALRASGMLAR